MKELIGLVVDSVFMDDENEQLSFVSKGISNVYVARGECCKDNNNVWFAHVTGINNLLNERVVAVDEVEMNESIDNDYADVYSIKISTRIGYCDIEFRNDHNGYYGGWYEHTGDKINNSDGQTLREIKEDF